MLELHLDPVGGIAGDMFAAAILDLRPDLETGLRAALALCPLIEDVEFERLAHNDGVLTGQRFLVRKHGADRQHPHAHHHHHDHHGHDHGHDEDDGHDHGHSHDHTDWRLIHEALVTSGLDRETVRHAVGIFSLLAEAEAHVHGMPVDDVRFHEVGAWDSIADIIAASWLIKELATNRWTVGPVPLGSGRVKTAHGLLAVPAPATVLMLEGFETIDDGIAGERVTPTGAAILRYLCERTRSQPVPRKLMGSSHGFGTRRMPGISNCLRVLAFETAEPAFAEREQVAVLECEIDDQTGEDLAHAVDQLRAHPAVLDVIQASVFGKKGRMMTHLRILAKPDALEHVLRLAFDETTTIGIRHSIVARSKLTRSLATVEDDGHVLNLKRVKRPSGPTVKLEADDVAGIKGNAERMKIRHLADTVLLTDEEE
ncbi:MAG: LarC family nickel insertion protein [Rhizobium sp.]|nr:LarC family nickel insertion protein [Rhizobium sp.]